ncbi:HEXXH motif domain-containing protein [Actinacidiphila yanglinensis]|uniref:HEXXH motif domain-containing protein n=1 Tax=Actinacidiphila yanglinensis TaxID=310779 RepID=UPI001358785D|nr:HEXXH motif domain-containing protein [Actinacidiphila yanglinensis]
MAATDPGAPATGPAGPGDVAPPFGPSRTSEADTRPEPLPEHRLRTDHFRQLARGSGDAATVAALRAGQRSRRLLMLRALVVRLLDRPDLLAPLPGARVAWQLLLDAERVAPQAVEEVVMHPYVGTWIGTASRALWRPDRRPGPDGPAANGRPELPWEAAGYLFALAASAAVRAGIRFRVPVPVLDGGVLLPATGRVPSPREAADHANAEAAAGPGRRTADPDVPRAGTSGSAAVPLPDRQTAEVLRLLDGAPAQVRWRGGDPVPVDPDADGPGWWALRRLHATGHGAAGEVPAAMTVDDVDPWRDFLRPPVPPARLPAGRLGGWQEHFADAWELVAGQDLVDAAGLAGCLRSLAPLWDRGTARAFSGSAPDAFGGVLMSTPSGAAQLAATLVHESQHVKLSALDDLVPLLRGSATREIHHSPWRADPRPVRGILQGTYAFLGVALFWHAVTAEAPAAVAEVPLAEARFEFALRRAQSGEGLATVLRHAPLTPAGEQFTARVEDTLRALLRAPVPAATESAVQDALADHRMLYRLSHLRPPRERAERCARALLAGEPLADGPLVAELHPARPVLSPRAGLLRVRFSAPARLAGSSPALPAGTRHADRLWAAGETAAARDGYLDRIDRDPRDVTAWAGLGLTVPAGAARRALRAAPEWVAAVHAAARALAGNGAPPAPEEVAAWLAPGLTAHQEGNPDRAQGALGDRVPAPVPAPDPP